MKKIDARASVHFNGDFFEVSTMSQGMLDYAEPDSPPHYLAPDVNNETLGHTLRLALKASKRVSVEEFQKIWTSRIVHKLGDERDAWAMKHYGYKTKRAMYKNMDRCSISVADGQIEIAPMHHKSLDGYSGISNDGPEILRIPETATDTELGAALREGFARCTSALK